MIIEQIKTGKGDIKQLENEINAAIKKIYGF